MKGQTMKKLLRFVCVALLTGAMVVACGDDEAVTTVVGPVVPIAPAPIFGSVSGTVSVEGSGLPGVSVNLVGAASQSATTGSSGGYSFGNVPAGTHGVQISGAPAEVAFVSTASVVTISTSGQTATADFSGNYIRTSSITGSVTAGGQGVVATVTASGAGMLMSVEAVVGSSDTDGDFTLSGLRAGTYHVAISDFGDIDFPVTTRDVTVGVGLSANVSFSAPGEGPVSTAFLVITGVTDTSDDDDTYSGRLTATVDIERGDARFEKITLYVDGTEVASQSFGLASAPAEDPELAAAQQIPFSLSFDSDEYDETTGAVTYPNGDHAIVVGLTVQGSTEEAFSNRMEVEFDNPDGVHALANFQGDPVVNPDTGERWYGGPDAGLTVAGIPVIYSGDVVGSLTLLDICGNKPITDSEAPFVFDELECDETRVLTQENDIFRLAEREVGIRNGEGVFPLRLDFEGPGAPRFQPNPNDREGGWINDTVELTGKYNSKTNKDGWLVYGSAGGGVGGNAPQLRYTTTTPTIVDGAIAAEPSSTLPEATSKATSICFVVSAVDLLGNESGLPKDGDVCVTAAVYETAVGPLNDDDDANDDDAEIPAGLLAGVDVTAPTIAFSGTSPKANGRELTSEFQLQVADVGKAGLHPEPVLARVEIRNAKNEVICGDGDEDKKDLPGNEDVRGNCLNTVDGLDFDDRPGSGYDDGLGSSIYYCLLHAYGDGRGITLVTMSEPDSRTALHDGEALR